MRRYRFHSSGTKWQACGGRRRGLLINPIAHDEQRNGDNTEDGQQCQQVLYRQRKPAIRLSFCPGMVHRINQFFSRSLIYSSGPATRLLMNAHNLFFGQAFQPTTGTFKAQREVFPGFIFFIRLKRNGVETLFAIHKSFQPRQQGLFTEQEDMWSAFRAAFRESQQGLHRCTRQPLGIIDQQVDFLPGQCQLDNLRHDRVEVGTRATERLGDLLQDEIRIHGGLRRDHHALDRLLVAARNQRLTHQGLAAPFRPCDHQQQLAVTSEVMQLPQHRLALGREKLETGHASSKGVMTEPVMAQERIVSRQTGHEKSLRFTAVASGRHSRRAMWRPALREGSHQSLRLRPAA